MAANRLIRTSRMPRRRDRLRGLKMGGHTDLSTDNDLCSSERRGCGWDFCGRTVTAGAGLIRCWSELEAQIFHFGGGYLHGSEAVAGKVVEADAEKELAFGGALICWCIGCRGVLEFVGAEAVGLAWSVSSRLRRTPPG